MEPKLIIFSDLMFPEILKAINDAKDFVQILVYVFKANYPDGAGNREEDLIAALIAAVGRGVDVKVLLNYAKDQYDVAVINYEVAQRLHAGGCEVRMGPPDTTLDTEVLVVDDETVFSGSHDLLHGMTE